ncbi:hypothetical protein O0L34_g2519 [Tuta absoluta]|nr:hypothetical protein O0L34_g2519 [Tuta absoluta]
MTLHNFATLSIQLNYCRYLNIKLTNRSTVNKMLPVDLTLEELLRAIKVPSGSDKGIKARRLYCKRYHGYGFQCTNLSRIPPPPPYQVYCFYTSLPDQKYVMP